MREDDALDYNDVMLVNGEGEAKMEPTIALIRLRVRIESSKADNAYREGHTVINSILDSLKDRGVSGENIRSSEYDFGPLKENVSGTTGKTKTVGYRLRQDMDVSLEDELEVLERKAAEIVGMATKLGVEVSEISFGVKKESLRSLEAQALANAARDAKAKAEAIAEPLGLKDKLKVKFVREKTDEVRSYGGVGGSSIRASISSLPQIFGRREKEPVVPRDVLPSQVEIRRRVWIGYEIQ